MTSRYAHSRVITCFDCEMCVNRVHCHPPLVHVPCITETNTTLLYLYDGRQGTKIISQGYWRGSGGTIIIICTYESVVNFAESSMYFTTLYFCIRPVL